MQKGLIGVIVPVYNVEKYVAECIESILAQTYTCFRLILVDDGTPDNAGKICDEYAQKDPRITVIHQENAGVTRARARGVKEANDCEFITFVDSDDTIITDALKFLIETSSNKNDIIISYFEGYTYPKDKSISIEDYRHYLTSETKISCGPNSKLYRRTIFNDFCFSIPSNIVHGEDLIMNLRLAFNTQKRVAILPIVIYNYRERSDSCDNTFITSPYYESLFFEYLIQSIPSTDLKKYYKDTVYRRITILKKVIGYKYFPSKEWMRSKFRKKLVKDIKTIKIEQNFLELITIKYSNLVIRGFAVFILKFLFRIKFFFKLITK